MFVLPALKINQNAVKSKNASSYSSANCLVSVALATGWKWTLEQVVHLAFMYRFLQYSCNNFTTNQPT